MDSQVFNQSEYLKLPEKPGIYKFFNSEKEIIYVGKAKSLKKRVASYFTKSNQHSRKILKLISEIKFIGFTIVSSEFDALLLENNLIKENQPKYNILMKDDKSYPSICITNQRFPRVFSTRRIIKNQGEYFGPYSSVRTMNNLLELIQKLYTIRSCKYNLTEKNVQNKKYKICLEYHIGNCKGSCEGLQSENDYLEDIESVKTILKGKTGIVKQFYKDKMTLASEKLEFEKAHKYKEKYELVDEFQSRSLIVGQKLTDIDVFTIVSDEKSGYVNYLRIQSGSVIATETVEVKKKIEETENELLRIVMFDIRQKHNSKNKEILTNIPIESWEDADIHVPKIGDKKKLIELSIKNSLFYKKEKLNSTPEEKPNFVLKQLKNDLSLYHTPYHIECFDNSNIQGTNPVASMVCFINGKPSKSNYRKFNIKTVEGPDDFASMEEIVTRRYSRLIKENKKLPNLIIIDGGKGQLSSACTALKKINLYGKIPIIGIAKRLEEIYYPEDNLPLYISKKSSSLKLIQQMRDEAHRFAITFHRDKRSKNSINTSLENISGIGEKTILKLLKKYKSFKRIKEANKDEIEALVGKSKTQILLEAIKKES